MLGIWTLCEIKLDDKEDSIKRKGELFVTPFGENLPTLAIQDYYQHSKTKIKHAIKYIFKTVYDN